MTDDKQKRSDMDLSVIDSALLGRFAEAESEDEFCRIWLALLCSITSISVQGLLVLSNSGDNTFHPVAKWPEDGGNDPERLAEISERVIEERCGLLLELKPEGHYNDAPASNYGVAFPIIMDDQLYGLVALEVLAETEDQLKSVMGHLQWGVGWMELMFRRRNAIEDKASLERLKSAVDIMACVLSEKTFNGSSMSFVTEMATYLECDRVSLGFILKKNIKIQAVSHSTQIADRMNLMRAIRLAMDEAVTQRKDIYYPPSAHDHLIVREHESLARQHGAGYILTIPFYGDDKYYGVLTLERSKTSPFKDEEAKYCHSIASLILPVLEIRRQKDRPILFQIWDMFKTQLSRLIGSEYTGRKLLALLMIALVIFFSLKKDDYKISANTVLEGAVKRVIVAPFAGYVEDAPVTAGDLVDSGTDMCILDERELRLERINWLSKRTQYQRQYQEALANHDRAEAEIIKAQLDQATAQLDLVESQLERTRITAPFRGIVLSGDLSQRLGGAVEKGEILFEIAPLDAYRIILEVDERRITDVKVGQSGQMILSALPREKIGFTVEKITPISTAKEGLNYFRVEAKPLSVSERLRPGMEGIGKIHVDRRNMFTIWTRDLREWIKLRIWAWWS